ncbi:MAG: DMT family transporter [Chitinophagaceae bacterium]|nr:MAG: DMT family transporter [Chitinophagaceae bacterium]
MKKAFIYLHLSVLLAGFTGVFGRLIEINAALLTWYRLLFSAVIIVVLMKMLGKFRRLNASDMLQISFAGFLLGLHWVFFYASIKYSNISVGVVCFSLTSFFTAVIEPVMNRRKYEMSELVLSGLTLAGIALIFGFDTTYRFGIMLGVISSLIVAVYTILNKRLTKRFDSETITTYNMIGGFAGISLVLPVFLLIAPGASLVPSMMDLIYLLILAGFCTVLLYLLVTEAMQKISAFTVNLSFSLEPLYSIVLAIIIFHENTELSAAFYVGLALIVLSVVLQMYRVMEQRRNIPITR